MKKELKDWQIIVVGNAANGNLKRDFKKIEFSLVIYKYMNARSSVIEGVLKKLTNQLSEHFADLYKDTCFYTEDKRVLIRAFDTQTKMRFYLGINCVMSILSTNLIYIYNQIDSRFHKICTYLRFWRPRKLAFYPL